mmetsp:Transcript_11126/g.33104  ORF Transcript_11126/g.33104 Transcript_11126/m.33104 type:complete len:220 (+) Transcript_11126:518-1177(+)
MSRPVDGRLAIVIACASSPALICPLELVSKLLNAVLMLLSRSLTYCRNCSHVTLSVPSEPSNLRIALTSVRGYIGSVSFERTYCISLKSMWPSPLTSISLNNSHSARSSRDSFPGGLSFFCRLRSITGMTAWPRSGTIMRSCNSSASVAISSSSTARASGATSGRSIGNFKNCCCNHSLRLLNGPSAGCPSPSGATAAVFVIPGAALIAARGMYRTRFA